MPYFWNTKNVHKYNAMHKKQTARITIGKTKFRNDSATEIRRSLHWLPIRERIDSR